MLFLICDNFDLARGVVPSSAFKNLGADVGILQYIAVFIVVVDGDRVVIVHSAARAAGAA